MLLHPCIIRLLCGVIVYLDSEMVRVTLIEHVALADNAAISLLQVRWTPGRVKVMGGHQPLLDIHASAHFGS